MKKENNITHYRFLKQLSLLPCVKKIILFGSRARKDNLDRSDIDLAIDSPNATVYVAIPSPGLKARGFPGLK